MILKIKKQRWLTHTTPLLDAWSIIYPHDLIFIYLLTCGGSLDFLGCSFSRSNLSLWVGPGPQVETGKIHFSHCSPDFSCSFSAGKSPAAKLSGLRDRSLPRSRRLPEAPRTWHAWKGHSGCPWDRVLRTARNLHRNLQQGNSAAYGRQRKGGQLQGHLR